MSNKWNRTKKVPVDGIAFKHARQKHKNTSEELMLGEYGAGTQEWLSKIARVSPRTITELETGHATLKTIDAISNALKIKGRTYILGYGEDFTAVQVTNVIDFRPIISGRETGNETAYLESPFLVTLVPISINLEDDFTDTASIKKMRLKLTVGTMDIDFVWLYQVSLTSRASTWLGNEEEIKDATIHTGEKFSKSIMFRQEKPHSWKSFIDHIENTDDKRILIKLTVVFEYFQKQENIMISVRELRSMFKDSYPQNYPYWIQPDALMI